MAMLVAINTASAHAAMPYPTKPIRFIVAVPPGGPASLAGPSSGLCSHDARSSDHRPHRRHLRT